jgi:membrane fusion protein (multidrug efflux system)
MEPKSLTGHVNYLDAEVNRQTSTVLARATFQNPGGYYLPGQFVRVKLRHLQVPHVLAVPEVAVTQGQSGSELYVLGKHNKARSQQVELGQSFGHGGKPFAYWVIVKQGLKPGARVVVNHIASVKAGERIKPQALPGKARSNKRHRSIGIEKKRGPGQ